MPKLKKRRNVPSQRKPKKRLKQSCANSSFNLDHSYNKHDKLPLPCLQEEMDTIHIQSVIEDESDHPYNTHGNLPLHVACLQEEMDTIHIQPDVEDKNDHSYNQHDVSTTSPCLRKEIETIHIHSGIADIKREEIVKSDPISSSMPFENLKNCLQNNISKSYMLNKNSDNIQIVQVYSSTNNVSVKMNVTINQNFIAKVFVHRIELSSDHHLWFDLPTVYDSVIRIQSLLSKLDSYSVCVGNYDNDLMGWVPDGSAVQHDKPASTNCQGFRERDFSAVRGSISYSSTVRSIKCALLVQGNRCFLCSQLRRVLISGKYRQDQRQRKIQDSSSKPDYLHSKMQHSNMSRQQLIDKINQQKYKINILQSEIVQTRHQFPLEITSEGVT